MWFGLGILGIIVWIIVAFWPARVASRKGHSFLLWFIISIFFWWISLFVVYFGLSDKRMTASSRSADKAAEEALDKES